MEAVLEALSRSSGDLFYHINAFHIYIEDFSKCFKSNVIFNLVDPFLLKSFTFNLVFFKSSHQSLSYWIIFRFTFSGDTALYKSSVTHYKFRVFSTGKLRSAIRMNNYWIAWFYRNPLINGFLKLLEVYQNLFLFQLVNPFLSFLVR